MTDEEREKIRDYAGKLFSSEETAVAFWSRIGATVETLLDDEKMFSILAAYAEGDTAEEKDVPAAEARFALAVARAIGVDTSKPLGSEDQHLRFVN